MAGYEPPTSYWLARYVVVWSNATAGASCFGSIFSDPLSSSGDQLSASMILRIITSIFVFGLAHGTISRVERTNFFSKSCFG